MIFIWKNESGQVIEASGISYNANCQGYKIKGVYGYLFFRFLFTFFFFFLIKSQNNFYDEKLDDGVFEPGEKIEISEILVYNSGQITLPSSQIYFPSTPTIKFEEKLVDIPQILPNSYYLIPESFFAYVYDIPEAPIEG